MIFTVTEPPVSKPAALSHCPFRFCGQYEDEESGLYYNRFRYYSPETAQYISADPLGRITRRQWRHSLLMWESDPMGQMTAFDY
ncbi:RHS repeat-associated core domain-containing protein, partial [Xenorhabdus bovienii]|nr:RHS repeat-associated core domain-containing protein [Xenorhabdus bovienii]